VGFRSGAGQVCIDGDGDEQQVCRRLREEGLGRFVRVREEPDRPAIRSALACGEASESLLAQCGVRVERGDERFYCLLDGAGREVAHA